MEMLIWEENRANRALLDEYERPHVHFENVTVVGGFTATIKLTLPSEIDINSPTQTKYAMVVEVYGGPGSVEVTSGFSVVII